MLSSQIMSRRFRWTCLVLGWVAGPGLVLWLGMTPAMAQRKRDKAQLDTTAARPTLSATTTVRMEEETMFAEGMRYLITDEPTKAITQFGKVLQKNPANAAA